MRVVYLCALICSSAALLAAETVLTGRVLFNGLPVPGATVTALRDQKRAVTVTDTAGEYSVTAPSASGASDAPWQLDVTMLGFLPMRREIKSGGPAEQWDLQLAPLAAIPGLVQSSRLQVREEPPQQPLPKQDKPLPAPEQAGPDNFRDQELADLTRKSADSFLINGSSSNGAASPFGLPPAFGNFRRAGKSLYNGGLGFTLDNSSFDARPYSLTGQNTERPAYNLFTGLLSFGGPIKIPHLIRSGPNVTINYQWTRNRNASTQAGRVPTAAERNGDLSAMGRTAIDPSSGVPFGGNLIPQSRISPQARALLALYPLPNFEGGRYNYQAALLGVTHQDSWQTRANHSIGRRNQLFGGFSGQSTRGDAPSLLGFLDKSTSLGMNANVNWRQMFHSRLYGTLSYQYSRLATEITPHFAYRQNISGAAAITGNSQSPQDWGPPNLSFAGGTSPLSDASASLTRNQTNAVSYGLLWVRGRHNLQLGGEYKRQQFNVREQQDARGSFAFTGAAAGSDLAGFLLGIPDTSSIAFGNPDKYFRSSIYNGYVSDDYRVSPGLTVNLGLRWDYWSPISERYGRLVNLDAASNWAAVAPVVAQQPAGILTGLHYPDSLIRPDRTGFQPRFGVSWRPFAASSMVVRAGYGLYRNTSVYFPIASLMAQQSPLSKTLRVQNSPAHPLTLSQGFNGSPEVTTNTFAVDPNFRVGYSQNWEISAQRDLPGALVLTTTYSGSKGTRAVQQFLPNTYPAGESGCPLCPSGFTYMTSNGNSIRHAGQIQLRRRMHNGLLGSVQYTWAKSIDNAALGGKDQTPAVIAQNWLDLRAERALSSFDQRHAATVLLQYTTGMGSAGAFFNGWKGTLLKEWTLLSQLTAATGLPLTPLYFDSVAGTGVTGTLRPDYTGAPLYEGPAGLALNPAAYIAPAIGRWGNSGRNTITGPSQFTLNAALGRTFRMSDRWNLDVRLDAMNAVNRVTYTGWVTTVNSAQFGLPIAANPMRSVQTTVRLRF